MKKIVSSIISLFIMTLLFQSVFAADSLSLYFIDNEVSYKMNGDCTADECIIDNGIIYVNKNDNLYKCRI